MIILKNKKIVRKLSNHIITCFIDWEKNIFNSFLKKS